MTNEQFEQYCCKLPIFIALFLFTVFCTDISAQSEITYSKGRILQDGTRIKAGQVRELMSLNGEALKQYNSGRTLFVTGEVVAYPSIVLLGMGLGRTKNWRRTHGDVIAVSAVGTAAGFVMILLGENKMKKSVRLYHSTEVSFQVNETGIGISVRF